MADMFIAYLTVMGCRNSDRNAAMDLPEVVPTQTAEESSGPSAGGGSNIEVE
jgi:hypothetical protein